MVLEKLQAGILDNVINLANDALDVGYFLPTLLCFFFCWVGKWLSSLHCLQNLAAEALWEGLWIANSGRIAR